MPKLQVFITTQEQTEEQRRQPSVGHEARAQLLAAMPVTEQRWQLAGVSTAELEGGDGLPVVLLHGPGEYAAHWLRVIPGLVTTHHVIAPDLPGRGISEVTDGLLDAGRLRTWLGELIEQTCASPTP
jgi:pimeloyl-ACP methyl ester carboxylesterase